MSRYVEESVKLPEALERILGKMSLRFLGYFKDDEAREAEIMAEVRWNGRSFECKIAFPSEAIYVDEQLETACRALVEESVESEGELEYRIGYVHKVIPCAERAAKRLWKFLLKPANSPEGLRPVPRVKKLKTT